MKNFTSYISIIIFSLSLSSCNEVIKTEEERLNQLITPGEWFNEKDSTIGLSVRKNRLGIIKNMSFTGKEIYDYHIVDSVEISRNEKKIIGKYLILNGIVDTLKYEYNQPEDSIIELKINNTIERFKWKRLTIFSKK